MPVTISDNDLRIITENVTARSRLEGELRAEKSRSEARLDDQRRELVANASRAYARASYPLSRIEADEYRDTYAVLAEVRSRGFAARLSYSDPDGGYTVEALISLRHYWPARRLQKEFTTQSEAEAWFDRVVSKFYHVLGFTCQIDY